MFPIVAARDLALEIRLFRIRAPRVARRRLPGQFVICGCTSTASASR